MILLRHCCASIIFAVCCCFSYNLAVTPASAVSNHLIPLSAVNFDVSSPQTVNVRLSQIEYEQKISTLKKTCEGKYSDFSKALVGNKKTLSSANHVKWKAFIWSLQETLNKQLNTPVKVFYGVKEKERITNIYRDAVVAAYEQRISDLERWANGNFAPLNIKETGALKRTIAYEENLFNERASRNIYLMEERYRKEEFASQRAWRKFQEANLSLIETMTSNSHEVLEERVLMLRRINDIRALQAEGLVFFKRERED
ncbi:MAG: hypothetical protein SOR75_06185 [Synergistes jonesii]|uniref:hypothetical protein n=1 Tax=Synergistes jonesii TaxID=2754 RepID=UPI002A764C25|nr:hypothetical protein [Synergistes jonesii]MDY2984905.1 hypothetical protein [Synergistes jonesii]